jgi:hypothetical protein
MSMNLATPAWTDPRLRILVLVALVCTGSLSGVSEGAPVAVWVATAVFVAVAVGLALDVWGGLVAGLGTAALLVGVRQLTGHWSSDDFLPALLETVAIIAAAAWAGVLGHAVRAETAPDLRAEAEVSPYGDLGLLGPEAARARLEEEVAARGRDGAALGLVLVDARLAAEETEPGVGNAARRCVARLVESRTADLDVPFALSADRVGVIFPHASGTVVWDSVGRVLDGVRTATLTVGPERRQVPLSELVSVRVGVSEQPAALADAESLMAEAAAALELAASGGGP